LILLHKCLWWWFSWLFIEV